MIFLLIDEKSVLVLSLHKSLFLGYNGSFIGGDFLSVSKVIWRYSNLYKRYDGIELWMMVRTGIIMDDGLMEKWIEWISA